MRNKHCQLAEKILKYTLVSKSQNNWKSLLHVYAVFSQQEGRWHTIHFVTTRPIYHMILAYIYHMADKKTVHEELGWHQENCNTSTTVCTVVICQHTLTTFIQRNTIGYISQYCGQTQTQSPCDTHSCMCDNYWAQYSCCATSLD